MWNTLQNNCISNGIGIRGSKSQVCFHIEDFIPNHTLLCMQVCKNGSHFLQGTYIFNYALTTKVSAPVTRHVEPLTLLGMQCERQRILFKQDQGSVLLNASGLFLFFFLQNKQTKKTFIKYTKLSGENAIVWGGGEPIRKCLQKCRKTTINLSSTFPT